jgi:hypothetical protein
MKDWIPLIVAAIAALTALTGYLVNSALSRRLERTRYYADALTAVEKYRQLPYTFKRRHDSTGETRAELATLLADTQVTLAFHRRWLALDSQAVGQSYNRLIDKLKEKNSDFRRDALSSPAAENDPDIEIDRNDPYRHDTSAEMNECIAIMKQELKLLKWPRPGR